MIRTHRLVPAILAILLVAASGSHSLADDLPVLRVGIITDGAVVREESFVSTFKTELEGVAAGSYRLEFPDDATVHGDWRPDRTDAAMTALLGRDDLDVVLAAGIGVAANICRRTSSAIPVVVPFAFGDCAVACPTLPNVSTRPIDLGRLIARDLAALHEIVPFTRLAVLMDPMWPSNCSMDELARSLAPDGVELEFVTVTTGVDDASELLPTGADAVYLMPLLQFDEKELEGLLEPSRFVGRAPQQVREYLEDHVKPILSEAGELPEATDLDV